MSDSFDFMDFFEAIVEANDAGGSVDGAVKDAADETAGEVATFYEDSGLETFQTGASGGFETFVSVFDKLLNGDVDSALIVG